MNHQTAGPFQTRLALSAEAVAGDSAGGVFEVIAITAGEGNGWIFGEAALQESLPLWDGADCYVDHSRAPLRAAGDPLRAAGGRSVRDLAGVLAEPAWDAARRGVRCRLIALGPSGPLLAGLGRQMLPAGGGGARPKVGFSADVIFTAQGRSVQRIVRVLSVDLVLNPARGGAFLRALDAQPAPAAPILTSLNLSTFSGEPSMTEETTLNLAEEPAQENSAAVSSTAVNSAAGTSAAASSALLEYSLAAACLPDAQTRRIRQVFSSRIETGSFEPSDLLHALDHARQTLAARSSAAVIQGPGRVSGMFSSEDQYTAALYDLLGAQRPDDLAQVKTARLSGIRELYTRMTGDTAFTGGFDPLRAQFATTADLPGVLKNAMNRLIVQEWQELGRTGYRWWEAVTAVEHFNSLHEVTGVLVGEVTLLPVVAEGDAYLPLDVADSAEIGAWTKYGGYIGLTLEMFERDETHKLRAFPKKLASAGLRRISALVGSVFTAGGGLGPNMADANPVFGAARGNLGTSALDSAAWEAASSAIYNQTMLTGLPGTPPKLALDARYLLVPRALRLAARQILYPNWEREAGIVSENMQRGEMGDVITCPELADANDWAAAADPRLAPGIILGERFGVMPEIIIADQGQGGALFTHDEVRMKARHWLAVFVADYRPLYKANVV